MTPESLADDLGGALGLVPVILCLLVIVVSMVLREAEPAGAGLPPDRRRLALDVVKWALVVLTVAVCGVRYLGLT
jgi:hypothetical protein